jgi:hypothetical protein
MVQESAVERVWKKYQTTMLKQMITSITMQPLATWTLIAMQIPRPLLPHLPHMGQDTTSTRPSHHHRRTLLCRPSLLDRRLGRRSGRQLLRLPLLAALSRDCAKAYEDPKRVQTVLWHGLRRVCPMQMQHLLNHLIIAVLC